MPEPSILDRLKQRKLFQWALAYAAGAWALLEGADLVGGQFDWPRWLLQSITILVAVGFVVVLVLAWYHGERGQQKLTGREVLILAGVLALGAVLLAFLVDPASAPEEPVVEAAAGERVPLILADFENHTPDPELAEMTSLALRTDLAGSRHVSLVAGQALAQAMRRMELDPSASLTREVAVEIAQRTGVPFVVAGRIDVIGDAIQFLAELIQPGEDVVSGGRRVVARDSTEIFDAWDELARGLREDAGESAASLAQSAPLRGVTTQSLEALRLYTRAYDVLGDDPERSVELLEQALEADTSFAMAYRVLGSALNNAGMPRSRVIESSRKAYLFRDRLPERERLLAESDYHGRVTGDPGEELRVGRALAELFQGPSGGMASAYRKMGRHEEAAAVYRVFVSHRLSDQANSIGEPSPTVLSQRDRILLYNYVRQLIATRNFDEAAESLDRLARGAPDWWLVLLGSASLAKSMGEYDRAERHLDTLATRARTNAAAWRSVTNGRVGLYRRRGQVARAQSQLDQRHERWLSDDEYGEALLEATRMANLHSRVLGDRSTARSVLDQAVAQHPTESILPYAVHYPPLIEAYAWAGRPDVGRTLLAEYEERVTSTERGSPYGKPGLMERVLSQVALAEGDVDEAVRLLRRGLDLYCYPALCAALLAEAHDQAARPDSAIAWYGRYLETPRTHGIDDQYLAPTLERLAQLHDEHGDPARAAELYAEFIALWEVADPELQPRVEAVRARLGW